MLTSIIGAIFVLSFCILVHELGHFIAARISGVKVKKFSIGFGKKLFGFKRNDCEYQIALIPFGGYVKLEGEFPFEERCNNGFYSKPTFIKVFIATSGVLMNLFFGWLLFFIIFVTGVPSIPPIVGDVIKDSPAYLEGIKRGDRIVKIGGEDITGWEDIVKKVAINPNKTYTFELIRNKERIKKEITIKNIEGGIGYIGIVPYQKPKIGSVVKGFPGEKSGLKVGDVIKEINKEPIFNWDDMCEIIYKNPGIPCSLKIERNNKIIEITVIPKPKVVGTKTIGIIGIKPSFYITKRYSPIVAAKKAFSEVVNLIVLNIIGIYRMITGEISPKMISGPIGILQIAGKIAHEGLIHLLKFTALISICLVIINLLPIPIADGGLVLFFIIEGIRKKPFSKRFYEIVTQVGIGIVLFLFIFASINDIIRLFNVR